VPGLVRTAFRNVPDVASPAGALPDAAARSRSVAKSDSLQVHSENDVVYLLSAWVKAQETAGCPQQGWSSESPVRLNRSAPCVPVMMPALARWFKKQPQCSEQVCQAHQEYKSVYWLVAWTAKPQRSWPPCEAVVQFKSTLSRPERSRVFSP
jgi:hypothetical protein